MTRPDDPILTPSEIATNLLDAGQVDRATALTLEQRIVAYADNVAQQVRGESRLKALAEAVERAEFAVKRTKGERQKAVAQRVLAAVKSLLPNEAAIRHELERAEKQGYDRGFRDANGSVERNRNRKH